MKPAQIVWTLLEGFENEKSVLDERRIVGLDNFYTGVHLLFHLGLRKTDAVGTVRKNRTALTKTMTAKEYKKQKKGLK